MAICDTAEARDPGPDLAYSAYYSCYLRWLWKAYGCNGLWPLVVESLWLKWLVAAGCGKP